MLTVYLICDNSLNDLPSPEDIREVLRQYWLNLYRRVGKICVQAMPRKRPAHGMVTSTRYKIVLCAPLPSGFG